MRWRKLQLSKAVARLPHSKGDVLRNGADVVEFVEMGFEQVHGRVSFNAARADTFGHVDCSACRKGVVAWRNSWDRARARRAVFSET